MLKRKLKLSPFNTDSSIFTSILVLGITALTMLARISFPTSYFHFFLVCGFALFVVNFSTFFKSFFGWHHRLGMDALLTTALLVLVSVCSFLPSILTFILSIAIAAGGFTTFLLLIYQIWKPAWAKFIVLLFFSVALAIWMIGYIHSAGIHHPLNFEKIAMGTISRDLVFHTSIAEMIKTYG